MWRKGDRFSYRSGKKFIGVEFTQLQFDVFITKLRQREHYYRNISILNVITSFAQMLQTTSRKCGIMVIFNPADPDLIMGPC